MELDKHKYHRCDLGVAIWTYFEDLWRHKKGQYWPIRGQLGESPEPAVGLWNFKQRSRGLAQFYLKQLPDLIYLTYDVTVRSDKVTA